MVRRVQKKNCFRSEEGWFPVIMVRHNTDHSGGGHLFPKPTWQRQIDELQNGVIMPTRF